MPRARIILMAVGLAAWILGPAPAQAYCVKGDCFCVVSDCSCWMCSGDVSCEYCNIFGCNCQGCDNFAHCFPPPSSDEADQPLPGPDGSTIARPRFQDVDANADQAISRNEFLAWAARNPAVLAAYAKAPAAALFRVMDTNGDGVVAADETGCPGDTPAGDQAG